MADSGKTRWDRRRDAPYRVKLLDEGTMLGDPSSTASWVASGTGVTATTTKDTICGHPRVIATTTSGAITLKYTPVSVLDLTGKTFVVRFEVGSAGAAFSSAYLYVTTSSGNYYSYKFGTAVYNGWYELSLDLTQFSSTGTPDISNIHDISIKCNITSTEFPAWILLDHVGTDYPGPCIIIPTSDDNDDIIIDDYYPVLAANGMTMSTFVIADTVGDAGYLTEAELDTLYAAGWDVGVHGATNLTTLTESQLHAELQAAQGFVAALGYEPARSTAHYAIPFSATSAAVRVALMQYFRSARSGSTGLSRLHATCYSTRNWQLIGYGVDTLSAAEVTALFDIAIATKSVFIPYWHTHGAADFTTEIEYLKAKVDLGVCQVMTMSEYWAWRKSRFGGSQRWKTKVT